MVPQQSTAVNPLIGMMRQPKIYIRLPSGGNFWPEGSLVMPESGEFPVYSMTAKDELALKIPDALMNGQAVVDVIQNCMPNIKNAWQCPNLDLDVILIAIRIATYGEYMTVPINLAEFNSEYQVDLRRLVDQLQNQITWTSEVPINEDLTVYVRPISYKTMTSSALQTFETQKIIQLVNDDSVTEENKIAAFKESFAKLNQLTIGIINDSVYHIESSQGSTSDPKFINEFLTNTDKEIFDKIKTHIETLRENNTAKPMVIDTTDEMRAAGVVEDQITVPIQFDPSNFFV
jgi:hypothetical protein